MDLTESTEKRSARDLRVIGRIVNLQAAVERLVGRLERNPEHRNIEKWKKRLLEYQQSLTNLRDHGKEVIGKGSGITGVEIRVPSFDFAAKPQAPTVEG